MNIDDRFQKPPIIIGGCGRSGTSLLLSVLSAHPSIIAIPEETGVFCPTAYTDRVDLNAPLQLDRIDRILRTTDLKKETVRWCEKTPKNVLFFGRLLELFGENVRLLNIIRDGRDVITSRHPRDPKRSWVGVERWVQDVNAGVPFDTHPHVLLVRYEDLVLQFSETVQKIFEFLEEDFDDALLTWHQRATVRSHLAWSENVRDVHGESIGKWRQEEYRDLVAEMMADRDAVGLLKHYGYVPRDTRVVGRWRPDFAMRRLKRRFPRQVKMAVKHVFNLRHSEGAS